MNGFRAYLIPTSDCHRERLQQLISAGATAVCLPIIKTRTGLQSAADEANRLGLPVFGWIELPEDSSAEDVRRLVEAYPTLDGYFLNSAPDELLSVVSRILAGYRIESAPALETDVMGRFCFNLAMG